jgi:hypothetical protein
MLLVLLLVIGQLNAQEKFTLSGYIKDSLSGETLIGANLTIKSAGKSVSTNGYGFFSITLPKGTYLFNGTFIGYQSKEMTIDVNQNQTFNLLLNPNSSNG